VSLCLGGKYFWFRLVRVRDEIVTYDSSLNLIVVCTLVLTGSPWTSPGAKRQDDTQRITLSSNTCFGSASIISI